MWGYNTPPVPPTRSLEGDDDEYLGSEISYNTEFNSSLCFGVDNQFNDINNAPYAYSNPPQPQLQQLHIQTQMQQMQQLQQLQQLQSQQGFHFNPPVPLYTSDGGSPSHVPISPTLSPLPTTLSPYGVPSPTSTSSPSSPETLDTKALPFLHLSEKKRSTPADIENWGEYTNPAKAYSDLYDSHNRLLTKGISLRIRIAVDKSLEYSHVDDAHIMYRQNQFSLEIDFIGELAQYTSNADEPLYVLQQTSAGSSFVPVEGLFFYVSFLFLLLFFFFHVIFMFGFLLLYFHCFFIII
jgi:hypothetical protein